MTTTPPPVPKPTPGPDPGPPHVRVEMLSCPRFLAGAREMVASLARRLGFSEVGASQVALAVDEALANVIRHGYDRREDQPIWMMIWQLDEPPGADGVPATPPQAAGLRIVIEDMGRQIEPSEIKGRDLDDIRPGGLGVHIIKEVMDEVAYEKRPAGGMRLTLVKRLESVKDRAVPAETEGSSEAGGPAPPAISVHAPGPATSASQSSPRGRGNVHG